jgi:hypothetical protein
MKLRTVNLFTPRILAIALTATFFSSNSLISFSLPVSFVTLETQ